LNADLDSAHLIAAPVLLPLFTAAVLVAVRNRHRNTKALLSVASMLASVIMAAYLLMRVNGNGLPGAIDVYLPGNWPVPFGIVLVLDHLSALMLLLSALVGFAAVLFSLARWHAASVHFHPMLQLQLMGLNGAFLTGDLFNLFVFFEVLLAASYGLLLHGGGTTRVRAGLHSITINLLASLLFLVGVALLYGITGTLNMADIASKLPHIPSGDRGLLHAAAALLGVAFLTKAAFWPLNFWLPPAYAAASAPAAAMFAVLTKVGVYAVLRLWTLCFPANAGESALFGHPVLLWGGMATLTFGSVAMLASFQLARLGGFSIIISAGLVLAAVSMNRPEISAGALLYMGSSTLGAAALFLLIELVERSRRAEVDPPSLDADGRLPDFAESSRRAEINLDDEQVPLIGRPIPAAVAFLGTAFLVCTFVLAGLPPQSGFVGKFAMLSGLLNARAEGANAWPAAGWLLFGLVIASGFLGAVGLVRAFITHFWSLQERAAPHLRLVEGAPVVLLLAACTAIAVAGESVIGYARTAATQLHAPQHYISAVNAARPVPPKNPETTR